MNDEPMERLPPRSFIPKPGEYNRRARIRWDRDRAMMREEHFDTWIAGIAEQLQRPRDSIVLLDIPATYALQDRNVEANREWIEHKIPYIIYKAHINDAGKLAEVFRRLRENVADTVVYFHPPGSEYFGAIQAGSEQLFDLSVRLFDPKGNGHTFVTSADGTCGMYIGSDIPTDQVIYELIIWGERWVRAAS